MKVFISWSGTPSLTVARALYDFLRKAIQKIDPFLSAEGIVPGARWNSTISERLDQTDIGILCLTKDNLSAPWLLFEAGALAKKVTEACVCPLLIGISNSDVDSPLSQFQAIQAIANREGILKLVQFLNGRLKGDALEADVLGSVFDANWEDLDAAINDARKQVGQSEPEEEETLDRKMIRETLERV